jgi:hypothetical protein
MGEMNNSRQPYPPAGVQPSQTKGDRGLLNNGGTVVRVPRAVAIIALALSLISFPLLCILLIGSLSETSLFYFFGSLLLFSGMLAATFFVLVMMKARATRHWARAAAIVVESEVVWGTTNHGGHTAWTWLPRFTYQYEVGGQVYRGGRIAFYRRCTGSRAQELAAHHPNGSQVQVYYDPAHPAEAVLDRSFPGLWWLPFFPMLLLGLAVVFFKLPSLLT